MSKSYRAYIGKITRAAIFLALLIVFQFSTASFGQYVTGSLVNFTLIACTLTCGIWCGLAVALLSPVIAFLIGIGPALPQVIPFIMLGNCALVAVWFIMCKHVRISKSVYPVYALSAVCAAVLKFLIFYIGFIKLALPAFLAGGIVKAPQVKVLSTAFSFPQLITALIGGLCALIIVPQLKKVLKS